jgi:hypothetical protein
MFPPAMFPPAMIPPATTRPATTLREGAGTIQQANERARALALLIVIPAQLVGYERGSA